MKFTVVSLVLWSEKYRKGNLESQVCGNYIFDLFCYRILGSMWNNSLAISSEAPGKDFGGRLSP